MRHQTKFTLLVVLFLGVIATVGCQANPTPGYEFNENVMEMHDLHFSGSVTHTVTLSAGDVITVDTRGNAFNIDIVHESGTSLTSGIGMTGRFNSPITIDGDYLITIEGSGSFRVSWE